ENIGVASPFLHGMKAFWHSFVREGGIFEGKVGREISMQSYCSELLAYTTARKLKAGSQPK
ncbi:MAG: hypothetical protein K2G71_00450, partial [Duncaniella sp.]|nr:hypothetical protein [Duncaniella sp.]